MAEGEASSEAPRSLFRRLRWLLAVGPKPSWYLTVTGAMIGLLTGLSAIAFDRALHWVTEGASEGQRALPLWLLPAVPMLGALATGLLVFFLARDAAGHGVPQVLDAVVRRGGRIPARVGIVKALASIATVGSGGSGGTEGPIVQIGAAAGSAVGRRLGVPREHVTTMVGCGTAAAIATIFNAPLAGVFFTLEILLRDFSLRTFTPVVIASVFATAVAHEVGGASEAIFAFTLPEYEFAAAELPGYAVLGVVCAVVAYAFTQGLHAAEALFGRLRAHPVLLPVAGAMLLGLLGVAWTAAGAGRVGGGEPSVPEFFGNGYGPILTLLDPAHYTSVGPVMPAVGLVLLLCAAKTLATALTLGSRGSGGVFGPSLFVGACAGAGFGLALQGMGLLGESGSPASYALVGMAAVVAGTTFAPLTAILLLFELTREPRVLGPIMLAAIVATGVARLLMRDSIYTFHLRRAGVLIGTDRDLTLLRRVPVARVEATALPREPVYASDPLSKLITLHAHHNVPDFAVVDGEGKYIGMVTGTDMRTALIDREAIPLLLVAELLRADLPTIRPDETLDTVLDKFARHDVASLALVDPGTGHVRSLITRTKVMACYQRELEEGG